MGELIDITDLLKRRRLESNIEKFNERMREEVIPPPETFGWKIVETVDDVPVKYFNPSYRAFIGYVPNEPEYVYLDYNHETKAWHMSLEELALGLEFGTLPDSDHTVDSAS